VFAEGSDMYDFYDEEIKKFLIENSMTQQQDAQADAAEDL
jgi:hypothetical protein